MARRALAGRVRVGISGWSYKPWRGVFYPAKLRIADQLSFASRAFSTIELNGTFYSLQLPSSYRAWYEATPEDFVFAVKGGKYITHLKRLREPEQGLANFFASGVLELKDKLGPILWQLPPTLQFEPERLKQFFEFLPRTHADAAKLARRHSPRLSSRVAFGTEGRARIRHALEVRHPSFVCPEAVELMRRFGVAPCIADSAGLFPRLEDLCADFVYVRLHGAEELYTSGYSNAELANWASRIRAWRQGRDARAPYKGDPGARGDGKARDVFVYFDNDVKVRAPF
ncbi:MAG TPA: DUF72 domain-containing protein, partial [Polyangiaceae bacterium]|nr:DUF72 domain-containing protein [Polyangiaceae bacterium]